VTLVDLAEGSQLLTEIDAEPGTLRVGQRVALYLEDHYGASVPIFRPAG
jgi:hypothetical protein